MSTPKTTEEMREILSAVINDARDELVYAELEGVRVKSYSDTMLLTIDDGLVLKFRDGTEYQITIVRSR